MPVKTACATINCGQGAASAGAPAQADTAAGHVAVPLASLDFQPLRGGPIDIAVLWGKPAEGPAAVMLRFPPKFPSGMHHHSHSYHAVLIACASKHWVKGESEADALLQRPGDYWYQAGDQVHQDSFPTDEPTILFLQFDGPMDAFFELIQRHRTFAVSADDRDPSWPFVYPVDCR